MSTKNTFTTIINRPKTWKRKDREEEIKVKNIFGERISRKRLSEININSYLMIPAK